MSGLFSAGQKEGSKIWANCPSIIPDGFTKKKGNREGPMSGHFSAWQKE